MQFFFIPHISRNPRVTPTTAFLQLFYPRIVVGNHFFITMRFLTSLIFISCLASIVFLSGCDRPEREVSHYGKVIDDLPEIPEAKEPFDIPEVEGIDLENIMRRRY